MPAESFFYETKLVWKVIEFGMLSNFVTGSRFHGKTPIAIDH
jgi:hypothetical protein